jgi:hypothetical protein
LQSSTSFNLNIEIPDLPTVQLAEATITGFNPSGRLDVGTLYLDTDANGLGWFIDPTPADWTTRGDRWNDRKSLKCLGSATLMGLSYSEGIERYF